MGSSRAGLRFGLAVTAVEVGVALAAFHLARDAGAGDATAYLIGSVGPLLGALIVWLRSRSASGASLAILAFTLVSAVIAVAGSHRPDVLLYKDAAVTALIGAIFAVSVVFPRPLAFYFGQRWTTDGTREGMQEWAALWRYADFRRANYAITAVWAVTYVVEAAVQAWLVRALTFTGAFTWTQVLPWCATGLAVLLTVLIARYFARREPAPGAARGA